MAGGAKGGGKGGSTGHASNAALDDDTKPAMASRRSLFDQWKKKKRSPNQMIDYDKSPPVKRT
jgi:hypothetical protein